MVQPAAPTRAQEANEERAFRGIDRSIETWLGVIPEQRREDGYVIDFKVGQSFGETQRMKRRKLVRRLLGLRPGHDVDITVNFLA